MDTAASEEPHRQHSASVLTLTELWIGQEPTEQKGTTTDYLEIAEGLKKNNCLNHWGLIDLQRWLNSGCRCTYCDKDLLECYEAAYYDYSYDHLLPKSEYRELENEELNLVLCCWRCNKMKSTWDANTWSRSGVPQDRVYDRTKPFDFDMRSKLIKRVKEGLQETDRNYKARFLDEQRLLRKAVQDLSQAASAATAGH